MELTFNNNWDTCSESHGQSDKASTNLKILSLSLTASRSCISISPGGTWKGHVPFVLLDLLGPQWTVWPQEASFSLLETFSAQVESTLPEPSSKNEAQELGVKYPRFVIPLHDNPWHVVSGLLRDPRNMGALFPTQTACSLNPPSAAFLSSLSNFSTLIVLPRINSWLIHLSLQIFSQSFAGKPKRKQVIFQWLSDWTRVLQKTLWETLTSFNTLFFIDKETDFQREEMTSGALTTSQASSPPSTWPFKSPHTAKLCFLSDQTWSCASCLHSTPPCWSGL